MTSTIEIKPTERGVVRVFAVDLDGDDLKAFTRRNGSWGVQEALGADTLNPDHVEVFPVSDLTGLGLSGYLEDGQGVSADDLRDMRVRLDALKGTVMVLPSSAFSGTAQTLTLRAPLRLIATFNEERPDMSFAPLSSEAATGSGSPGGDPGRPHQASVNRLLRNAILLSLAIVVLALLIMVAT